MEASDGGDDLEDEEDIGEGDDEDFGYGDEMMIQSEGYEDQEEDDDGDLDRPVF